MPAADHVIEKGRLTRAEAHAQSVRSDKHRALPLEDPGGGRILALSRARRLPARKPLDRGGKLLGLHGLGHVDVGATLIGTDPVFHGLPHGGNDDRRRRLLRKVLGDGKAAVMGQVDVDHGHVERGVPDHPVEFRRVARFGDRVTEYGQAIRKTLAQRDVVLDQYDPCHDPASLTRPASWRPAPWGTIDRAPRDPGHPLYHTAARVLTTICVALIFLVFPGLTQPETARAGDHAPALLLGMAPVERDLIGHMDMLRDPGGDLDIEDVAFGSARQRFTTLPGNLALGYTTDTVWLRVRLERGTRRWPEPLYLLLRPTYLDSVTLHVPVRAAPERGGDFRKLAFGDHVIPPAGEDLAIHDLFAELALPDAPAAEIYLRIDTTSSMSMSGQVLTAAPLLRVSQERAMKLSALIAVMFTFALIHFFYWATLRRPLFLSFFAFLVANILTVLTDGAILPPNIVVAGTYSDDVLTGWGVLFPALAFLIFTRYQLETRRYFPLADRAITFLFPLQCLTLIAPFTSWYQAVVMPVLLVVAALIGFLFVGNLILLLRHRRPGSLLATIATGIQLVGVVLVVGRLFGVLSFDTITELGYQVSSIAFVALMSLSLVQRARVADRRRRQTASLRIARKAEHAARQLVRVRTAELQSAKLAAETALEAERAAQAEQVRFVDVITHQYQTPLAVIRSSVAAIRHTLPATDTDNHRRVGQIKAAVRSLVEVLDVSLKRSRVEGVSARADLVPRPAAETLRTIVRHAADLAPERQVLLDLSGVTEKTLIDIDTDMVSIALTNLIDNALKFSGPDDAVTLTAECRDDTLVIRVRDHGIGIPEAETGNLAKRYFRASNTGEMPGSGLGLNIVAAVARAHGGRFSLENADGGGACAILELGLSAAAPDA